MKIGIDFDRVLFDTDAFNDYLHNRVEGFEHVEEDVYDENGNYSPEKHAEALEIPGERIYSAAERSDEFLFPDAEMIGELRDSHEVIIVTRGEREFQESKIENSGILEHVDGYVIVENGSKQVPGLDLLVDDLEEELEKVDTHGFLFDREEHDVRDIIKEVRKREA